MGQGDNRRTRAAVLVVVALALTPALAYWSIRSPKPESPTPRADSTLAQRNEPKRDSMSHEVPKEEITPETLTAEPQPEASDTLPAASETEEQLTTFELVYFCTVTTAPTVGFIVGTLDRDGQLEVGGWYNVAPGKSKSFQGVGNSFLVGTKAPGMRLYMRGDSVIVPATDSVFEWRSETALESRSRLQPEEATIKWLRGAPEYTVTLWTAGQRAEYMCGR